jgi:DNA-binding NarL/FixJ family response regulator
MPRAAARVALRPRISGFQFLVLGKSVSEIATKLKLSVKTVSTHKAHLLEKMGLANQAELIHYAIKHRLSDDTPPPE